MTITKIMLKRNRFLVKKIEKFASENKLSFSQACVFLLQRLFNPNFFRP